MGIMVSNKKAFRFEDYSTADEAKAALLTLYPLGIQYPIMVKILEEAGASCALLNRKTGEKIKALENDDHFIRCSYTQQGLLLKYEWAVFIECEGAASRKNVKSVKVIKELITL